MNQLFAVTKLATTYEPLDMNEQKTKGLYFDWWRGAICPMYMIDAVLRHSEILFTIDGGREYVSEIFSVINNNQNQNVTAPSVMLTIDVDNSKYWISVRRWLLLAYLEKQETRFSVPTLRCINCNERERGTSFAEFNRGENDWNIQYYSYAAFLQFSVDSSKYLYGSGRYPRNITVDWLMRSDRLETFVGKTRHYSPSGISYG